MEILDKSIKIGRPKAILFDWDNTLVDSLELICTSMRETFSRFKLAQMPEKEFMKSIHGPSRLFIEKHFPKESYDEARKTFLDLYDQFTKEKLRLLPSAQETLDEVQKQKIKTGVVSNKVSALLSMELYQLGLKKYFLTIVGSGDLAEDKPSPLPVLKALKDIEVSPSQEVWFVGDSAADMGAAHNSNCLPVFFGSDDYTSEHYEHCQPKVHFKNHKEFIKYLASLND